jgi:putative colanic acid biosynthesis acetyltransferase WcaF
MTNSLISDLSRYKSSYNNKKNFIVQIIWYFLNAIIFKSSFFPFYLIKRYLLVFFGAKIGQNFVIKTNVNIKYPWNLNVGNNVWLGENVWIDNLGEVIIGDSVCISQGVYLLTGNHNYKMLNFELVVKPININSGVWIGAMSIVCPGVTMEPNSVLSVGSVLTHDSQANYVYSGSPAILTKARI